LITSRPDSYHHSQMSITNTAIQRRATCYAVTGKLDRELRSEQVYTFSQHPLLLGRPFNSQRSQRGLTALLQIAGRDGGPCPAPWLQASTSLLAGYRYHRRCPMRAPNLLAGHSPQAGLPHHPIPDPRAALMLPQAGSTAPHQVRLSQALRPSRLRTAAFAAAASEHRRQPTPRSSLLPRIQLAASS
jgi:hypothetical protein